MGGFFGVASKDDCVFDLFFGVDYHSHLGSRRGGMAVYDKETGFSRSIHKIDNAPFRTKFENEANTMHGQYGVASISDYEPQPILVRSNNGTFAITTVGRVNNIDEIVEKMLQKHTHFYEMQSGGINQTELIAALINQKDNLIEGIQYAQEVVEGSISILLLTPKGIYAARDKFGRTPVVIGKKDNAYCVCMECYAHNKLGYHDYKELGPGEIVVIEPDRVTTLVDPGKNMKMCTFFWVYYGYPSSAYEGMSVEQMRYNCGKCLAERDGNSIDVDIVAGVPDSGLATAIGYSNESVKPFARPFIKYTPAWSRSFTPTIQSKRKQIAKMKLIPIRTLIEDKKLLLVDDSIVRGTQLGETTDFLYECGAKEVHIRTASPPVMYGCKYLNFSTSSSEMELITRRVITEIEGKEPDHDAIYEYSVPGSEKYNKMVEVIREKLNFTSLEYLRLDDMLKSTGVNSEKLCTYCWNGKE
ncbi:MAG: amidophosphoribosyltransferase [Clostridia bacterium]|nr:amidophosphoribosyltransferase [Clostridia bacterium]